MKYEKTIYCKFDEATTSTENKRRNYVVTGMASLANGMLHFIFVSNGFSVTEYIRLAGSSQYTSHFIWKIDSKNLLVIATKEKKTKNKTAN